MLTPSSNAFTFFIVCFSVRLERTDHFLTEFLVFSFSLIKILKCVYQVKNEVAKG